MTLTELMVAVAVVSIGVLGMIGAFGAIQKSVQVSKNKTFASNLAQEQMQILGQYNYYQMLVTPSPQTVSGISPTILYDNVYFPPQTILEGGVNFTRYTYVQQVTTTSGTVTALPPQTPDTGLRMATVTIAWTTNGQSNQMSMNTLIANPNTAETNAVMNGTVTDLTTSSPINGALVNVAENMGWRAKTNASGAYSINALAGNFTMDVSAPGYFPAHTLVTVAGNQVQTTNFALQEMSSGTVLGTAWVNTGLVISQVVVSTVQASLNNMDSQYVELYNPTPNAITVNTGLAATSVQLNVAMTSGGSQDYCPNIVLNYTNNAVPAYSYYLIASTSPITIDGVPVNADAVYASNAVLNCSPAPVAWNPALTPPVMQILYPAEAGYVWLSQGSGTIAANTIDSVGWQSGGSGPAQCGSGCMALATGIASSAQIVRTSSPTFASNVYGRAYDSGVSTADFVYATPSGGALPYNVFDEASGQMQPIAGRPALGAVVTCSDGLSASTRTFVSASTITYASGWPVVADFVLTNVATATVASPWTMLITSGAWTLENDTVTIPSMGSLMVLPSSTTILSQSSVHGFVAGYVTDVLGNPISSPVAVPVSGGGASVTANATTGRYLLRTSSGSIDVTANAGSFNSNYVSISSLAVTVQLGQIADGLNFALPQGGQITGYVTRDGVNPLPGITVSALDANGYAHDTQITNSLGGFTTMNISTGVYTVVPELDSLQTSSPTSVNVTVANGLVFSTTFTISGSMGVVSGAVSVGGAAIPTGVLIVVTTATLSGTTIPALSSMSATAPYYSVSSLENGSYSVSVAQSTNPAYNIYAYYSSVSPSGAVTIQTQSLTNVPVAGGTQVSGKNFAW